MPAADHHRPMLVLGTGELGRALLTAMLPRAESAGIRVDVLVRSQASTSAEWVRGSGGFPVGFDIAAASEAELANLFGRYDTVMSCVGFAAGSGTQLKLARAALASGVRRYFPWQFGVDYDVLGRGSPQPLFDEQLDVRDLLRAQHATRWVIVSVGMFTSFLFEPSFGVVDLDQGVVRALGSWDNAVTVTTPGDIGRLTTEIVFTEPEFADEVVHLAGDTVTYGQLADMVERVLGHSVTREVLQLPDLTTDLSLAPDDTMRRYRAVFAMGRGMSWNKDQTFNARRRLVVTDAESWLRVHLAEGGKVSGTAIIRIDEGERMSQAVVHGDTIYLAGQVGTPSDSVEAQTNEVLAKIDALLGRAGSSRDHLLRATIWLADMADYDAMNRVWDAWVAKVPKPVRATCGVGPAIPRYAVEIVITAVRAKGGGGSSTSAS